MLALKCKFYSNTFKVRRKIVYAVQGQLRSLLERRKKFITLVVARFVRTLGT